MKSKIKYLVALLIGLGVSIGIVAGVVNINIIETKKSNAEIEYSEEQIPASLVDDQGEVVEVKDINDEEVKTIEEVDGGLFEDEQTGVSVVEGEYSDLGWSETFNTSSPSAFMNDTLGKCIYANNRYGAQCVSLSRVFWWSYANRDVSTCGTGMAKGMMNCWQQNAGNDFYTYWKSDSGKIQAGDWLVFDGGMYGHVGMALGPVKSGYVALLGENQGGRYCEKGGAATNVINISIKNLIGYYRPKSYAKPTPKPQPEPKPTPKPAPQVDSCKERTVKKGETMGSIMKECEGKITWGSVMDNYANSWVSKKTGNTVFYGWTHGSGYGLFANDTIVKK